MDEDVRASGELVDGGTIEHVSAAVLRLAQTFRARIERSEGHRNDPLDLRALIQRAQQRAPDVPGWPGDRDGELPSVAAREILAAGISCGVPARASQYGGSEESWRRSSEPSRAASGGARSPRQACPGAGPRLRPRRRGRRALESSAARVRVRLCGQAGETRLERSAGELPLDPDPPRSLVDADWHPDRERQSVRRDDRERGRQKPRTQLRYPRIPAARAAGRHGVEPRGLFRVPGPDLFHVRVVELGFLGDVVLRPHEDALGADMDVDARGTTSRRTAWPRPVGGAWRLRAASGSTLGRIDRGWPRDRGRRRPPSPG